MMNGTAPRQLLAYSFPPGARFEGRLSTALQRIESGGEPRPNRIRARRRQLLCHHDGGEAGEAVRPPPQRRPAGFGQQGDKSRIALAERAGIDADGMAVRTLEVSATPCSHYHAVFSGSGKTQVVVDAHVSVGANGDVTLTGTFRCTRAALRQMVAQGHGGAVVNNASVLGWRAQPGQAHYAAAKAGVMALTRCAALDVAVHGIRVNAVAPSLAMHPFLAKVTSEELLAELVGREAFGRSAEPWEVANVMVFLASDYASYLTGEVVSVSSQHP